MNGNQVIYEDVPKTIVARYMEGSYKRYLVKESPSGEVLVFLYQKLEELVLDAAFAEGGGIFHQHYLIEAAHQAHAEQWSDAWVPIADAVEFYSFTPKGFVECPVYIDATPVGRVLISENEGVIVPFLAKNTLELVDLIETIVLGKSIDALISGYMSEQPEQLILAVIQTDLGRPLFVFVSDRKIVKTMALGNKVKVNDMLESSQESAKLAWAEEHMIAFGALDSWDEGSPILVDVMQESCQKPLVRRWGARLRDLNDQKVNPQIILAQWIEFATESVAVCDRCAIGAAVGRVIENEDLDPLAYKGLSIEEWAFNQAPKETDFSGSSTISEVNLCTMLDQVASAVINKYPELINLHFSAISWAWRSFIHKVENPDADIIHDELYRIDCRPRSPVFLCFILFSATITDHPNLGVSGRNGHVYVLSASDRFKVNSEVFFLGLGQLALFSIQTEKYRPEEVIVDFCEGLRRLIGSLKAGWSLRQAIADPRQGYTVLTGHDFEYCLARNIPISLPVPHEASLQE